MQDTDLGAFMCAISFDAHCTPLGVAVVIPFMDEKPGAWRDESFT